jgi:hypothetical protein
MYYDTTVNVLYWWNGTAWISSAGGGSATLPQRLQTGGQQVTDWNAATQAGWYWGNYNAINGPPAGGVYLAGIVYVEDDLPVGGGTPYAIRQQVWSIEDATANNTNRLPINQASWARSRIGGQWGAWISLDDRLTYTGNYASVYYNEGEIVVLNGVAYLCTKSTNSAPVAWPGGPPAIPAYPSPGRGLIGNLPATPTDGQEYIVVDSLTNPAYSWHMRYNASSTSTYKWEYIGGSSLATSNYPNAVLNTLTAISVGTYYVPAVTLVIPRAGEWVVSATATFQNNGAAVPNYVMIQPFISSTIAAVRGEAVFTSDTWFISTAFTDCSMFGSTAGVNLGAAISSANYTIHKLLYINTSIYPRRF